MYQDITARIGNTPMVELWSGVYAKLEMKNPSGSVKDRAAKAILGNANLPRGSHIVEATSGNFGISLAFMSAVMGYSLTVVMPDGASYTSYDTSNQPTRQNERTANRN